MFFCFSVNKNKHGGEKPRGGLLIFLIFIVLVAVCLSAFLLIRLFAVPSQTESEEFGKINLQADTQSQREAFFEQFSVSAESISSLDVTLPESGEEYEDYQALQESQGFDLAPFAGKPATQYVLKLSAQSKEGYHLYGVLTVYKGKAIAVHLTDFVYPAEYLPLSYLG